MKHFLWIYEDFLWNIRCQYGLWLHGPYGLARIVEKMPYRFIIKYLKKYGARIGENCRLERGINIHRPLGEKPFENLKIGNNVYLGHNTLIDLTCQVELEDKVIIASQCQIWTHTSYYSHNSTGDFQYGENNGQVIINKGAIIYSGVIITYGVKIGALSIIGANSLVNKNIPAGQFWGGVPAKAINV